MDLLTITVAKDTQNRAAATHSEFPLLPEPGLEESREALCVVGPEDDLNDLIESWTLPKLPTFEIRCEIDKVFVLDPSRTPIFLLIRADSTISLSYLDILV